MGALPQVSVVSGPHRHLERRHIHRLFEENARLPQVATATALIAPHEGAARVSYAQLNSDANRYARCIRQHILGSGLTTSSPNADGDWIVAVCMPPTQHLIAVLLACWKMGAAYLPLEASFPAQRIEHILREAQPVVTIVAADATSPVFSDFEHLSFDQLHRMAAEQRDDSDLSENETVHADEAAGTEDDQRVAIVLYTSGSTGIPKGVRLPHSIIHNRLSWQWHTFPFAGTERTAVFKTALTFVDSVAEIWAPLLSGLSVLILPKCVVRDPERLVDALYEYRIERLVLVPTLLRALLMYLPLRGDPHRLHSLRLWVCSGETLSAQLVHEFHAYFAAGRQVLCNFYGSTEIMGDVTCYVCRRPDSGVAAEEQTTTTTVPIGHPIDNTAVYVLDGDMRPVKMGERGELYVAGRNLAAGYVGGRDKFRFVENPLSSDPVYSRLYRTGDYASVLDDGTVRYEGRTDSQIKIRGNRVDLAEVERQLQLTGLTDKALVLCYRPDEIDQALVAFVTTTTERTGVAAANVAAAQIEAALAERLTDYMRPVVQVIDTVPLLVNGKVDRQALLRMYAESCGAGDDRRLANGGGDVEMDYSGVREEDVAIARDLFETIATAIGRSARGSISLQSNFYQMGGNSLNSIWTVAQLRELGYERIGIHEFITARSLTDVLELMSDGDGGMDERTGSDKTADLDVDSNNNEVLQYEVTPLAKEHRDEVIELLTKSFFEKADIEDLLKPNIVHEDYADIFEQLFDVVYAQGLSIVAHDPKMGCIVGASLNTDAHCEPRLDIRSQLIVVFDFIDELQSGLRSAHPTTAWGQVLHCGMMGTSYRLSAQENIAAINCMEAEVLRLAASKGYGGVFTTNTSPLTQQLASYMHGYETVCSAQVNRWRTKEGWRPFAAAPDDQLAIVQWKRID